MSPGDRLRLPDGHYVTVTATHPWVQDRKVYNLTIHGTPTYYAFAGATPVLVHNAVGGAIVVVVGHRYATATVRRVLAPMTTCMS